MPETAAATRSLGRTGLRVSDLALGSVALGTRYGLSQPDRAEPPLEVEAIDVIRAARAAGIRLFDTAPSYGDAESLLGRALDPSDDCVVCTKVSVPTDGSGAALRGAALERALTESIEGSLTRLRRARIDVLQLHNATLDALRDPPLIEALLAQRKRGLVSHLGVSVYREEEALAAMYGDVFDVVQIGMSMLDQRPLARVLPLAERLGVGIVTRSALLKGALSPRARWLPERLAPVRLAADAARRALGIGWEELPSAALRFCLGVRGVASTLIGVSTLAELEAALVARAAGPLPAELQESLTPIAVSDPAIVNPARWGLP